MASFREQLKQELTCSICLEVYHDPHMLRECCHSFCWSCVKQLEDYGKTKCPECRVFSRGSTKDFKLQKLTGLLKVQDDNPEEIKELKTTQQCGMCQECNKEVESFCEECRVFICCGCATGHRKITALKLHNLKPVCEVVTYCELQFFQLIKDLEHTLAVTEQLLQDVVSNIHQLQETNKMQISELRSLTSKQEGSGEVLLQVTKCDEEPTQINRDEEESNTTLENVIIDVNGKLVQILLQKKTKLTETKQDVQSKIEFLQNLLAAKDVYTLFPRVEIIKENTKTFLVKVNSVAGMTHMPMLSPVFIQKSKTWIKNRNVLVKVGDITLHSQSTKSHQLFTDIHKKTFKRTVQVDLNHSPYKLHMIKDHLWCAGFDGLYVYDKQCTLVKVVKHEKVQSMVSLATVDDEGSIVVACRDGEGLHVMDITGHHHTQVAKGSFCDVAYYKGHIFALKHEQCQLLVLKKKDDICKQVAQLKLKYKNGNSSDRVCVQRSHIYITSCENHSLYKYDIRRLSLIKQVTCEKGSNSGEFTRPRLCAVDYLGNMLLCESFNNHRIQVYDCFSQGHVIQLPVKLDCPVDAILDDNNMWVIKHGSPMALMKFSAQ